MFVRSLEFTLSLSILLAAGTTVSAQQQSLFGGTGGTSSTAGAGGQSGGIDAGGSSFEQGGPQITTELGSLSQNAGQSGFLGRNIEGGFLGAAGANTQAQPGAVPNFRPGGQGGGNANSGGGQPTSSQRFVRTTTRIAFDFPVTPAPAIGRALRTRITTLADRRTEFRGLQVAVDAEGVARLTGTVPTESAGQLAVAMVRLEPGVRRVESELNVQPGPAPARP